MLGYVTVTKVVTTTRSVCKHIDERKSSNYRHEEETERRCYEDREDGGEMTSRQWCGSSFAVQLPQPLYTSAVCQRSEEWRTASQKHTTDCLLAAAAGVHDALCLIEFRIIF